MSKTIKYDTLNTSSRDFALPVEETVSDDDDHPFTPNVEDPRFCADCGLLLVDHGDAPKSAELTFDQAIKWAQEWQGSAELAIPAEIVTGLVDGALALKAENEELKGRNATQEESITHLQSQFRVMKEAIEDGIQRLEDNERWWHDARLIAELTPFQKDSFKARAQASRRTLDILRSAITPEGSEQ